MTTKWVKKQSNKYTTICTFLAWYKLPNLCKNNKRTMHEDNE